jgi:hypothetical protein
MSSRGQNELQIGGNAFRIFEAQSTGTSGATEPDWPAVAELTVVDNEVTWVVSSDITYWVGTWHINKAAADGWLLKAGQLAGTYGLTIAGNQLQRNQAYDHALKQHQFYLRKAGLSSVRARRTRRVPSESSVLGPLPTDSRFDGYRPGTRYLDITDPGY